MRYKFIAFLSLVLGTLPNLKAQQVFQFTNYLFEQMAFNPAVAGNDVGLSSTLMYRSQWLGIAGRPQTAALIVHQPLKNNAIGVGIAAFNDRIGNFSFTKIQPTLAYKYRLGLNVLSLGVSPVVYASSLTSNFVSISDKTNDPSIPDNSSSAFSGDVNIGVHYKSGRYFGGVSVVNVIGTRIKNINTRLSRTLFANAAYQFKAPILSSVEFMISANYRADLQNTSVAQKDLTLTAFLKDAISIGINYRFADSFSPIIGFQKYVPSGRIKVAYAYDYTQSGLSKQTSGSHEVVLNFLLLKEKTFEFERYKNVRFL